MADYPTPPKSDAEYRAEAELKLLGSESLETYLRREFAKQPLTEGADPPPAVSFPPLPLPAADVQPISEHHFLYGDAPHPKTHAHTAAVVDRVNALKPPSLVRMDRAEVALAAVVARRKLEQSGQFQTDQWWDLKRYEDGVVDRYIEAAS